MRSRRGIGQQSGMSGRIGDRGAKIATTNVSRSHTFLMGWLTIALFSCHPDVYDGYRNRIKASSFEEGILPPVGTSVV